MLVSMKEILSLAKENGYGVGFFNAVNVEMARAVIETAQELHSPVIVGTAGFCFLQWTLRGWQIILFHLQKKPQYPYVYTMTMV